MGSPNLATKRPDRNIARRLQLARYLSGDLTPGWAARRAGIDKFRLLAIEAELVSPTSAEVRGLAQAYTVSEDWILGLVPEQRPASELQGYLHMEPTARSRLLTILPINDRANPSAEDDVPGQILMFEETSK